MRHQFRTMLLNGVISGFTFNTLCTGLDREEAKDKARLFVTRMRLQDRDALRKAEMGRPKGGGKPNATDLN